MSVFLSIVAPVFALILIGYLAGRFGLLSESAGQGVSDFAFSLGIPALLCRTIATAKFADLSPVGIWLSFFGAAGLTWIAATIMTSAALRRPAADAPAIAMSSVFGNTAMLGLPLAVTTFGPAAAAPIAVILSIHAPLLWLTGMVHSRWVGQSAQVSGRELALSLIRDLSRNPIIIGIMIGAAWRLTGTQLPLPIDRTLELLAQAGVPASLVALGLTLVRFEVTGQVPTLLGITALKLVLMPLAAYILAEKILALSPVSTGVVVILAAMPTGANAYLFANREGRALNSASGAVALGTLLAATTSAIVISIVRI